MDHKHQPLNDTCAAFLRGELTESSDNPYGYKSDKDVRVNRKSSYEKLRDARFVVFSSKAAAQTWIKETWVAKARKDWKIVMKSPSGFKSLKYYFCVPVAQYDK